MLAGTKMLPVASFFYTLMLDFQVKVHLSLHGSDWYHASGTTKPNATKLLTFQRRACLFEAESKLRLSVKPWGEEPRRGEEMCKTMLKGLALVWILGPAALALLPSLGCCFFRCPKPQARKCVHGDSRKFKPQPINRSQVSLAQDTLPEGAFISQSLSFLS